MRYGGHPWRVPGSVLFGFVLCLAPRLCAADEAACQEGNLLRNCDFEDVPYSSYYTQGVMPSEWMELASYPAADTYDTNSGDGVYGLQPSDWGDFTDVSAHAGERWVAGWSAVPERFGQVLTAPLEPGHVYQLSAFLHMAVRSDLHHPGTYEISLATGTGLRNRVVIGQFDLNTDEDDWEARDFAFEAPSDADNRPLIVFSPVGSEAGTSYPGLDTVVLAECEECEAPPAAEPPPPPAEVTCDADEDNLLRNCDFEDVPYSQYYAAGVLPDEWMQIGSSSNADTFDADLDDGLFGLDPEYGGYFTGKNAHAGVRWIAGDSNTPDRIGQVLTEPLVPAQKYELSAALLESVYYGMAHDGAYQVALSTGTSGRNMLIVGQLGNTTGSGEWEERSIAFEAPSDADNRPILVLIPVGADSAQVYPGIDSLVLKECDECETAPAAEPPPPPAEVTCQDEDNLIRNCDFEDSPYAYYHTQGVVPSEWITLNSTPDAYDDDSDDGIYGLLPEDWGDFTGVHAHAGVKWIAGWSAMPEIFGQQLTTELQPGHKYQLSGFLHMAVRSDLHHEGTYQVVLATGTGLRNKVVLGEFDPNTDEDEWEERSFAFEAPSDADNRPLLAFIPLGSEAGAAYPGLDSLRLVECPECETPPAPEPPPAPEEVTCDSEDNLVSNCDFETTPYVSYFAWGVLPTSWVQLPNYSYGADTYDDDSDDGGFYGVYPEYVDNFTGVRGHAGVKFVAAQSTGAESFGQILEFELEPGHKYQLSAFLHMSTHDGLEHAGSYRISLARGTTLHNVVEVGEFEMASEADAWEERSVAFEAPSDADERPVLVFTAIASEAGAAYPAIDSVTLVECPECETPPAAEPPPPPAEVTCNTEDNLIRNCDFEESPYSEYHTQGVVPSEWLSLYSTPDAWDDDPDDGVYGLLPEDWGDFTGVTAHAGNKWIAGWSSMPERFGQVLTSALVPSQTYELSGFLHMAVRSDLAHEGSYDVGLATDTSFSNMVSIGQFDLNDEPSVWQERAFTFEAPADADTRPVIVFTPIEGEDGAAYPGLDSLSLVAITE